MNNLNIKNLKMKKTLFLFLAILSFTISCSSDDSENPNTEGIDQSKIYGWWYKNSNTQEDAYKAYYFGEDGIYKQDMSNYGLGIGIGTWEWSESNEITMTPTPGQGIAGGPQSGEVFKLTNDSLVFDSEELRLSKNNPND